ncbi:unnamed protein product [Somion occarium]|uniref:DUF6535 domain-containing protein n=2 Tax=Somion occarium TaxID=3059160 RepID=A0ABP1DMB7_9APHY
MSSFTNLSFDELHGTTLNSAMGGSMVDPTFSGRLRGWPRLAKAMSEYDESKVRDCKEDMDTLLVFAGLFSAVLTAFNVESYKDLQTDPAEVTNLLLVQISQQLNSFNINGGSINSTIPASIALPSPSPSPDAWSVHINSLWFSALVCSLVTASLAMLVKQWLREYMAQDNIAPRCRTRIRFWRWLGLTKWRVFEIAAFLPMLLQLALFLFFAGLCILLLSLDTAVGWVVTALISIWASLYLSVTIAPVFSSKCPYKTPLLRTGLQSIRRMITILRNTLFCGPSYPVSRGEEEMVREDMSLDVPILVAADATMMDDEFIGTTMRECLLEADGREVVSCVREVISRHADRELNDLADVRITDLRRMTNVGRSAVVNILIDAVHREMNQREENKQAVEWVTWISSALTCIGSALLPLFAASRRASPQAAEARAGHLLIRLLGENERTARGVVEVLARSRYARLPSSFSLTEIISNKAIPNLISGSTACLQAETVEPLHLCQIVLYLTLFMQDSSIKICQDEFSKLLRTIHSAVERQHAQAPNLDIYPADLCLKYGHKLNTRHPGFVDPQLLSLLSSIYNTRV